MDNPKPKDESPDKPKFANSLVAMYGSGSDSSEDDDSQPNVATAVLPSEPSVENNLPEEPKTEKLSEVTVDTESTKDTSVSEANESKDIIQAASVDITPPTTLELPVQENASDSESARKTESDVTVNQSEEIQSSLLTNPHIDEVESIDCPASGLSEAENIDEKVAGNTVGETPLSIDISSKSDVIHSGDIGLEGISVDKTEKSMIITAKENLPLDTEEGGSKSVKDIVEEIDTILAQGAVPSKIKELQNKKLRGDISETTVEKAVSEINLEEKMDVEATPAAALVVTAEISANEDKVEARVSSETISEKISVDENLPAVGRTTPEKLKEADNKMEVTDEKLLVINDEAENIRETSAVVEEQKLEKFGAEDENITETSKIAEEQNLEKSGADEEQSSEMSGAAEDNIPEVPKELSSQTPGAEETASAKKEIPKPPSETTEVVPKDSNVEDKMIVETVEEVSKTNETNTSGTCHSAAELNSAPGTTCIEDGIEGDISVAEVTEEKHSVEENRTTSSPTRDVKNLEAKSDTETPVVVEETEEETTPISNLHGDVNQQETKPETVEGLKEEIKETAGADGEEQNTTEEKQRSSGVAREENAKAEEAVDEASDSSFATCEELDKSDEIAIGEEEVKFSDASDKITSEGKIVSPEPALDKSTAAIEESTEEVDEPSEVSTATEEKTFPEPVAHSAPSEVQPDEECKPLKGATEEVSAGAESFPIPDEQNKMDVEEEKAEVSEAMEVDEVDRVPPAEMDTEAVSGPAQEMKEVDTVAEEPAVSAKEKSGKESVSIVVKEPEESEKILPKDAEALKEGDTHNEKLPSREAVSKEAAAPGEDVIIEDVTTEGTPMPSKKKEPAPRRLRQVRHPSAKAAEAAADAAFVAAVTPTRANLKEAKIACAIANVTETCEVITKEHLPSQSRQKKTRSSSTEPQPTPEVEPVEQASDKPVSIKLKISKDAVQIVSNETSDPSTPPTENKRPKRDLSDLPAVKEPHYMKNLEVQIPQSDVNIYETSMSPGGTLRKHKRHKEGAASPSITLSPITLKIAKDKSNENLCCIVPEEARTASPVDSEGREKITLKISKEDKVVRSSLSPLVSPAERSEEARNEKAALKLAKEEAAALVRNREGVSSPRSDDGENRLERITLKLAVGEKNSWSIKSADSDSALSPSSTDSGSTKVKPKISVVRMEELLEGEGAKSSKRAPQTGSEGFVLQIAPTKRPLEEPEMSPSKVMKVEDEILSSVVPEDVEILEDNPEMAEEPVEHKPPIEEIILEDSSSMPPDPVFVEKPPVQKPTAMDVDDDVVILSAKIVKKARGRPRKVRPVEGVSPPGAGSVAALLSSPPLVAAKTQSAREPQDNRPKRVCKGRERPPPKPTKPRGRYAHQLKLRQAAEQAAAEQAAAAAAAAQGTVLPSSSAVTVTIVPSTTATTSAAQTVPTAVPTAVPSVLIPAVPTVVPTPIPTPTPTPKPAASIVKVPKASPAKTPRATAPKVPHPKSKIIRPEAPQVFEEETRMSADISTCPTTTPTQSDSTSAAAASAQATPAQQTAAQAEGRPGISFNSPLAAIDSTGILPRLVITPCTPVRSQTPALSTTGDESQSNSTTELTRASGNKKGRMEVVDPDAKAEFTVDMIAEYVWPVDKSGARGEIYMIQEQISLYLGVKSFKRKYPLLTRRPVEHEERQYLLDRKLVSEKLCDLGLTAVVNHEVLDVMVVDFPEKYEEYRKFSSEKAQRQLTSKQKGVFLTGRLEDSTSVSQRDAASFNAMLNRERREQRKCSFDLQAFSIQYPENRRKRMTPANLPKVGNYPVALVPGQYTDYYKKYTAAELRYFPLNTVLYGPLMPGEIRILNQIGGSEGSQTDSSDSSSSDSESSNSGSSGSSDSDSSSVDSDDEMSNQIEKTESRDSVPEKESTPCKVCSGDRHKNKLGVPEPLINCAVCSSSGHPTCLDLTVDMVPHIRKYEWQCTDCKTCAQCKDPADEDKMLFCDMCDRGYHIYCVGLRKVPDGRWHCKECALCSSCGARDPGGVPDQQPPQPVAPNNTPNKSELPQWQHEFKKGDKGARIYVRTLCVPCSRLWKKGRYCRLCWKCYGNKPEEEGLINCSACDRWMHSDCCRMAGSVIDDKTSNFLCELCQQKGVRSPTKNFKTPVR